MKKYRSQIFLAVTSVILSKLVFLFINDAEGPNLLVVTILAVLIYVFLFFVVKK